MAKLKQICALALVVLLVLAAMTPVFADVRENAGAVTIFLAPQDADLDGTFDAVIEPDEPPYNIGGWTMGDTVSWDMTIVEAGYYTLHIEYSRPGNYPAAVGLIQVEGQNMDSVLSFIAEPTGIAGQGDDWSVYTVNTDCGIDLKPGAYRLSLMPDWENDSPEYFINLRGITLVADGQTLSATSGNDSKAESGTADYDGPIGSGLVQDNADLFTDAEEAELRAAAEAYAANLGVHFVILTVNDASKDVLEDYSREFYETNVAGRGGIFECAMMTANMGTRRVANDFYGELRTMISDDEASVIREGYSPDLTDGDYVRTAKYFLDEAAGLVAAKQKEYRIDIPLADPSELVYDYAGTFTPEEYAQLVADARDLSETTGIPHYIIITGEYGGEEYLKRYASSFYKQNLQDVGGCLILTVSRDAWCAVSPFGSYLPENRLLWDMTSEVKARLGSYPFYVGCRYFLNKNADELQAENLQMPELDPAQIVYDFAGSLTDDEEESLRREIAAVSDKYGVQLYIVLSDIVGSKSLYAFQSGFMERISGDWYKDGYVLLLVGAAPETESMSREIHINNYGEKAYRKIGANQRWDLRMAVTSLIDDGDVYGACQSFVGGAAKDLSSLVPNVNMVDNFGWALRWSILAALVLPGLVILVLRIMHGFKGARKVPARSYLSKDSITLGYSRDVFVGSHTTRTKIQKESSSGGGSSGGSSGSSGGGISSRSEGSF